MRILFIAPLPPPITGHSLVAQVFLDHLRQRHDVAPVNLSVGSDHDGTVSARRLVAVSRCLASVWRHRQPRGVVYLTISESVAGNLKDLAIYALCAGRLSRMYIHLHGGTIKRLLFDRHPLLRRLNAWAIGRLAGVFVAGASQVEIFAGMISPDRIHVVPNFAQEHMFLTDEAVERKFGDTSPLRVLYLSAMTEPKGYQDLADAYLGLGAAVRDRVRIDFAGRFESASAETIFREKIAGVDGLKYHGLVDEEQKRALFARAHVFCLPTSMFEGQPISILEAYASGCVVLTTGQAGIRDVFADGRNGFEIDEKSPASIRGVLEALGDDHSHLRALAVANRRAAWTHYRTARHCAVLSDTITRES